MESPEKIYKKKNRRRDIYLNGNDAKNHGKKKKKKNQSVSLLRRLVGLGFWVQGFRCYPWTGVNFFLKDGLGVAPSTLQLLQNSANLPMVGKPLYGIVSDAVYINGQHRIPYLAFGALLQAVSWFWIPLLPASSVSLLWLTVLLLLGNLGASIAEVANDALVTESGKLVSADKDDDDDNDDNVVKRRGGGGGELQSFVWMLASAGGALGNLLGGVSIGHLSPQTMFLIFGVLLAIQFLSTIIVREQSLALPPPKATAKSDGVNSSISGIRQQLSKLWVALCNPDISYSIVWFGMSYAMIPVLLGTMFFYQTQELKLDSSVLGLSKVFGQAAMLVWSACYNKWLKSIPPRKLIAGVQVTTAVLMVSDAAFVRRMYKEMGVRDEAYVVVVSGVLEVLFQFKILPFTVLMAELCPPGCEASLMAFLMSTVALATIVSGYLGVALASYVGISAHDFTALPRAILIQAACTLLPLLWSSWIPDYHHHPQFLTKKVN